MANTLKPKRSSTASLVPTTSNLASGELGVNMADKKIYINNGTAVVQIGAGNLSGLGDVTTTSPSSGQSLVYDGTKWVNQTVSVGSSETTATIVTKLSTATAISDVNGNLRAIPRNSQTVAYTLVASDTGKHIATTAGGVTVPASIFSAGDSITIVNNSASSQVITQGASLTLRWAGQSTAITGNRTIALYGIATILFISPTVAFISGAGVT